MSTAVGIHRGGVVNTTQTYPNSTTGFQNVTPRMYAQDTPSGGGAAGNYGLDIDNHNHPYDKTNYNTNGGSAASSNGNYHNGQDVQRLETIVDRIVRRAGPPQSSLGNPGPLGLAAFAATTFVLSCWNAQLLVSTTANIVLGLALWYGGIAQLLAGMWEFAANNTFGATAFTSYGAFWLSFATINEFWAPTGYAAEKDVNAAVGIYLMAWTIFTGYMFVGSLRMSYSLVAVFLFLECTFALLTAARFTQDANHSLMITKVGGWLGIVTAAAAWYASAAVVINGTFGAQFLPVGVIGPLRHDSPVVRNSPAIKRRLTGAAEEEEYQDEPIAPTKQA